LHDVDNSADRTRFVAHVRSRFLGRRRPRGDAAPPSWSFVPFVVESLTTKVTKEHKQGKILNR